MLRVGAFRFAPPWWAWILYAAVLALLLNLGVWQLQRAHAKEAMLVAQAVAAKADPRDLVAHFWSGGDGNDLHNESVSITGRYLTDRVLLQDSQVYRGQAGYHVWTPMQTRAGLIMVNRGWIAAGATRAQLPSVETPVEWQRVRGQWRGLPQPGFRLGEVACDADELRKNWPQVVQYPRRETLKCLLGAPVRDGILLLADDQPHGYARDWSAEVMPPAKHYGYAFQWFALALALTGIFVVVNSHRENAAS